MLFSDRLLAADLLIQSVANRKLTFIQGDGILRIAVDHPPLNLHYAVGGFVQINLEQNRILTDAVLNLLELTGCERILDLYCWMGNFSLPLARRTRQVVGIEESVISIKMAHENAQQNQINNVEFYCDSAENSLSRIIQQNSIDILLLDPPRSGAYAATKELLKTSVDKIIYISCDPQTLARDVRLLVNNGYDLISSQPFDMFPQTHHCESVTFLQRKR